MNITKKEKIQSNIEARTVSSVACLTLCCQSDSVLTPLSQKKDMSENVCLRWNENKTKNCITSSNVEYGNDFSDVTLVSGDGVEVDAPKVIMAASIPDKFLEGHSGERPFPCTQCPLSFDGNIDLQKHLISHCGTIVEPLWIVEMFFCGYCTTNCASGLVDEKSKKENIFLDLQKKKDMFLKGLPVVKKRTKEEKAFLQSQMDQLKRMKMCFLKEKKTLQSGKERSKIFRMKLSEEEKEQKRKIDALRKKNARNSKKNKEA